MGANNITISNGNCSVTLDLLESPMALSVSSERPPPRFGAAVAEGADPCIDSTVYSPLPFEYTSITATHELIGDTEVQVQCNMVRYPRADRPDLSWSGSYRTNDPDLVSVVVRAVGMPTTDPTASRHVPRDGLSREYNERTRNVCGHLAYLREGLVDRIPEWGQLAKQGNELWSYRMVTAGLIRHPFDRTHSIKPTKVEFGPAEVSIRGSDGCTLIFPMQDSSIERMKADGGEFDTVRRAAIAFAFPATCIQGSDYETYLGSMNLKPFNDRWMDLTCKMYGVPIGTFRLPKSWESWHSAWLGEEGFFGIHPHAFARYCSRIQRLKVYVDLLVEFRYI